MKYTKTAAVGLALAAVLVLASCETTNKLAIYNFEGARMYSEMQTPPPPKFDMHYDVMLDSHNIFFSSLSVLSNIAKATQSENAKAAMADALSSVDVPDIILRESANACGTSLGTTAEERRPDADYVLTLSIHEWGIEADSPASAVRLKVRLTARIIDRRADDLVWRRTLTVSQPASTAVFGLPSFVGDMVTATALSNMTADDLEAGFRALAQETASSVGRLLQKDLDWARYGY